MSLFSNFLYSLADDLQLHMSDPSGKISELHHSMQSCICDVKAWETANMLKLNDNLTEFMPGHLQMNHASP